MRRCLQLALPCFCLLMLAAACQSGEGDSAPAMGGAQVVSTPYSMPAAEMDPPEAIATPEYIEITLRTNEQISVEMWVLKKDETPDGKARLRARVMAKDNNGTGYAGPETGTLDVFGEDGRRIAHGVLTHGGKTIVDNPHPDPSVPGFGSGFTLHTYKMPDVELISNVTEGERVVCILKFSPHETLKLLDSAIRWPESEWALSR